MSESRTKNSVRNYSMNVVSQVTSILLSFIGRTFFIKLLGIEYLGVNGLFSNILSLLSLAELGVGTAVTYMMYQPIAENDKEKVAAYNNLFRQIYNCIGVFIFIVGLCFTPFIYDLIKERPNITENLHVIYILYLTNSSVSYFFTYKRSLLIAYQKEYINSKNIVQFAIIKDVLLIALLYAFRNFYIYLSAQILVTIASNFAISHKTNKLFPDIVRLSPQKVPKSDIKVIIKNTFAMMCHKIGSVAVSGTGNIFISYFVGIATVGVYSNYVLLSNCARQIVGQGINSLTASFGNLVATSNKQDVYRIYKKIYFINFLLALSISVLFFAAVNPFVTIWIGGEYILERHCVLIIVVNSLFFYQIRVPSQIVINTYGLFWQIKWKSLVEAIINLLCSFIFTAGLKLGILGILLAALISNISTSLWWEPYIAFKEGMKVPIRHYFLELIRNCFILGISLLTVFYLTSLVDSFIESSALLEIVVNLFIAGATILLFVLLFYAKSPELDFLLKFLKIKK